MRFNQNLFDPPSKKPNAWQVLISVLGAIFGVQSSKVRQRDFMHGQPWWVYFITGLSVVSLMIFVLIQIVHHILGAAGS